MYELVAMRAPRTRLFRLEAVEAGHHDERVADGVELVHTQRVQVRVESGVHLPRGESRTRSVSDTQQRDIALCYG